MLHIAERCENDASFGATKLNKVLFFSDFLAFGEFGEPITGVEYFRLRFGPAPRRLLPLQAQLVRKGDAALQQRTHLGPRQKRLIALRPADLSLFTAREIALVDKVIEALDGMGAGKVSDLSHHFSVGWKIATDKEAIPYETVFLSDQPLTIEESILVKERLSDLALT